MSKLFPSRRVCVVCGGAAPFNSPKIAKDQLSILALNVTVYRRTKLGRQLATSKGVQVCEPCLSTICAEGATGGVKGRRLADALLAVISNRYRSMVEGDDLAGDSKQQFKQLFRGGAH